MIGNINVVILEASDVILPATNATAFILLILTLLFLVAIAAGAEAAFFSLTTKDINYLKTKSKPGSKQAIRLLDNTELLLAALRASKYILSIAIIISANYLIELPKISNPILSFLIILVIITSLLLLFGEILPKVYARENNVRLVLFSAPIIQFLADIFNPAAILLMDSKQYREQKRQKQYQFETEGKAFEEAVEESMGHAATKEEVDIFKGILKFGRISVKQIMIPRLDVNAIRKSWTFLKVREKMIHAGFSRLPVYDNSIDEIVGMVYTKDFLAYNEIDDFDWTTLIRPAYFVHQQKLIEDLLREFQHKRIHFAIVVDEFGGTSGIVTLEDIMEEIVGDIRDEFDEEEMNYRKIDDKNYIFDGKILINDMCRIMGISFETFELLRGESDSLAGLVLEIAGKFPALNEQVSYRNFDFTVLTLDKLRISRVKVELVEN